MIIKTFSGSRSREVRELVIGVLNGEGFEYDPVKDFDLDDIEKYYLMNGGIFYTGIMNGDIIGTSAVRKIDDSKCEIKRIYLKKEFRGRGFGRELFFKALEYAEKNFSTVVLKTDAGLKDSINMYLKNGFSVVKKEGHFVHFEKKFPY
jgi:putative acetyltransferase